MSFLTAILARRRPEQRCFTKLRERRIVFILIVISSLFMGNQLPAQLQSIRPISNRVRIPAIVLIILVGLFNFHIPHFLIETTTRFDLAAQVLELVLVLNVLGALCAAFGIFLNARWGWQLGVFIACVSFLLYLAQETVGLPGLPKQWLEPSRILSLILEGLFVVLALRALRKI